jgi:enterochelin esterase-like enzyme
VTLLTAAVLGGLVLTAGGTESADAEAVTPPVPGWTQVRTGVDGGTVWTGEIPNTQVPDSRQSAVYLPPGFDRSRRYPVVYLLHGLPGSPSSFYDGLRLADVADRAIAATGHPFIAVVPVGGPTKNAGNAEWAGVWGRFLVQDVVPWADTHLPTIAERQARALAGLCAGGYGAMNTGLRHTALFGTLESWEGYFAPVFDDGPFFGASKKMLRENDPTVLVRQEAPLLRTLGTRFYVSVGGNHAQVLRRWSLAFDALVVRLGLPHDLWLLPPAERGHFWRATVPSALAYAASGFPQPQR